MVNNHPTSRGCMDQIKRIQQLDYFLAVAFATKRHGGYSPYETLRGFVWGRYEVGLWELKG